MRNFCGPKKCIWSQGQTPQKLLQQLQKRTIYLLQSSMISSEIVTCAVAGKTARPCDSCIIRRARWYCAADDAFLCQACDSSVHSANSLARRHSRVRLKTASFKPSSGAVSSDYSAPSWHRRKARTPRNGKPTGHQLTKSDDPSRNLFPLVPEVGADETSHEENEEEHLLFRVPIFDPFVAELCTSANSNEAARNDTGIESKAVLSASYDHDIDSLHGFLPSDLDPAEFAADVESLLGRGLENECFDMEELGLMGSNEKYCNSFGSERIKLEEEDDHDEAWEVHAVDTEIDMTREQFELNFDDYDTPPSCAEEEDETAALGDENGGGEDDIHSSERKLKKRKIVLRLNWDAVISAWGSQGSPWCNGKRPDFEPDDCWPHCMGSCGVEEHGQRPYGVGMGGRRAGMGDGGREARVWRYKEKRRKRLFSKKIRYEVRKLNAEKRPRMKGRFVKRASFGAPDFQND